MLQIGSHVLKNGFILAPISGATNMLFRLFMKRLGAELVYTEMVSANGICYNQPNTMAYLRIAEEERPTVVQIFGSDPDYMAVAASVAEERGADMVDINMGCPVRKVTRHGAGAALLKDPQRALMVVKRVRESVSVPVMVKTRIGYSRDNMITLDFVNALADLGISALVIHGRTATDNYSTPARWEVLESFKDKVPIPIIPNGDLFCPTQIAKILEQNSWPAVMVARGVFRDPFIFKKTQAILFGKELPWNAKAELLKTMRWALSTSSTYVGEEETLKMAKKVLLRSLKGIDKARAIRQELVEHNKIGDMETLIDFLERALGSED